MRGDAGGGADRDGMVAAQNERNQIIVERFLDNFGEAFTGFRDFVEIFGFFLAVVLLFGLADLNVADIFHLTAELLQARLQPGDAQRGRAHIHAAAAGAQVHRHPDNSNFFWHLVFFPRPRTGGRRTFKDKRDRASEGRG